MTQSCLKTLREAAKGMAAQQNDYRSHQLLCFVLNDASEICHYPDPISRYLGNESTRWPKPTAHSRLSQSRRSRVDLLQDYRKVPFMYTVCSPSPCSSGMTRLSLLVGTLPPWAWASSIQRKWHFLITGTQLCP